MEAINKQREQLKDIKTNKQTNKQKQLMGNIKKKKEKLEEILLLTNNLNGILMTYDINFTKKGENILKNLVIDKKMINYQNLLFKTGNPIIDNFDFFKRFGTLYDLLTDLLNRKISTIKVKKNKMKW